MASPTRDQKLDALLSSAARVFAERGYYHTSMRDLARESGISLAGIYYYVQSKEELLFLIQSRTFEGVLGGMRRATAGTADSIERLTRFIDNHLAYFVTHTSEMKVLSHEGNSLTGAFLEHVIEMQRDYTSALTDILADIEMHYGPARVGQRVAVHSLFGMMNWIYNWYDSEIDQATDSVSQNLCRLFLGGYVANPFQAPHASTQ